MRNQSSSVRAIILGFGALLLGPATVVGFAQDVKAAAVLEPPCAISAGWKC
jgi:hypothetical protein